MHKTTVTGVTRHGPMHAGPWLAACDCGWRGDCPRIKRERADREANSHREDVSLDMLSRDMRSVPRAPRMG